MIPWVREKFAERRAKWLSGRNRKSNTHVDNGERSFTETSATTTPSSSATNTPTRINSATQTVAVLNSLDHARYALPCNRVGNCRSSSICHHADSAAATNSPVRYRNKTKAARRSLQSSNDSNLSAEEVIRGTSGKETIKVRVICPSARVLSFQTDTNKRMSDLKNEVILELTDDLASMPLFAPDVRSLGPRFRLVKADYEGVELPEQQTLAQLNIENNELLVLVLKRNTLQQIATQTREMRAPPDLEIEMVTRGIPSSHNNLPMVDLNEIFQQSNLQFDVRKVLISLAQASAMIIGVGPYAERMIAMLKQKLVNKRNYQNDTLQCLVDMGFKQEKAEYALKSHNNVYAAALEWLIQRQSEEMSVEEAVMTLPKSSSLCSPSAIMTNNGPAENVNALTEIVRIYSHREIPPTPDTVQSLIEMGFKEPEVIEALKKTCNNRAAACEWLCGNRTGSLVELRDGLSQDSPVLKTILELPQVQLSLGNPKTLLAFLAILENENTLRVWGGNDTSSVITHILQKYHEEKHVMGINQFYNNR